MLTLSLSRSAQRQMPSYLPIPGPLFGAYPQRISPPVNDWKTRLGKAAAARFPERLSELSFNAGSARFVRRVRQHAGQLASPGSAAFTLSLRQAQASIASAGFQSQALEPVLAHALVALKAAVGVELYDSQLIAARIMLNQKVAEMATGEGKTFAMFAASSAAALAGVPVHVVTANDYLAQRDAQDLAGAYQLLGLDVVALSSEVKLDQRAALYRHAVVYGAAKEFIFDYLLDRSRTQPNSPMQQPGSDSGPPTMRGLCLALIDEVDSVLIDEARTPFILAAERADPHEAQAFAQALALARPMRIGTDFKLDAIRREVRLTSAGRTLAREAAQGIGGMWSKHSAYREELVQLSLAALHVYQKDVDYVVTQQAPAQGGAIVELVDINSGRIATGRKLSNGLHQLLELKESCKVTSRQHTFAQLTFQRFFTRYHRLGGMSGTVREAAGEIARVYGLGTRIVPLRVPSRRKNLGRQIYADPRSRWRAAVSIIAAQHVRGRPVLIGTDSVADSEHLSALLTLSKIPHQVLNAAQSRNEAQLVAQAGQPGCVTVATNMAGRGTDIKLDRRVNDKGGLMVLSCQLNSEARIDRQLHGRCARQGDRGSVQTLLGLNEGLFERHLSARLRRLIGQCFTSKKPLPSWLAGALFQYVQRKEQGLARQQRLLISRLDEQNEKQLAVSGTGI